MQPRFFYFYALFSVLILALAGWLNSAELFWPLLVFWLLIFLVAYSSLERGIIFLILFSVLDTFSFLNLRAYHWVSLIIISVWVIHFIKTGKLTGLFGERFSTFKKRISKSSFLERIIFLFFLASILGLLNSPSLGYSLKQTIVFSFSLIIFLIVFWGLRAKILSFSKISKAFSFSLLPVAFLALYQNIAHEKGLASFEVMPARPNASFYEPDWLGMYLILVLPFLLYSAFLGKTKPKKKVFFWFLLCLLFVVLIITVARASWLAALAEVFVFFLWGFWGVAWNRITLSSGKIFFSGLLKTLLIFIVALNLVLVFGLTRFNLKDRFTSIYKKEHLVTMALNPKTGEKKKIDLEEIETYRSLGYQISEESVTDENVTLRLESYASNREIISEHWFLGQGQGGSLLKKGLAHNANNIFYEFWIAGGILGLVSFLCFLIFLGGTALGVCFFPTGKFSVFAWAKRGLVLAGILGLIIANLFNSGIYFAPLWIFLGIAAVLAEDWYRKNKIRRK